jgi:hypothetical protein
MDLDFSEEQHLVRDMSRAMLAEHCPVEVVRQMEDDPKGYPDALWKQVSELGLAGIRIPEEHGGSGQSLLDAALVYEEFGRAMAPTPHFVSCVLSAGILLTAGSDEQKTAWLERIAHGEAILTPAWLEPDRGYGPKGIALEARADGDGFALFGVKRHVHFARAADRLIVLARSDAGIDLFLVDPNASGVTLIQQKSLASDCQYRVEFENVRVSAGDRVGAPGSGWDTWEAWPTTWPTPPRVSTAAARSSTRPHGITPRAARSRSSRRWRNCSPARPIARAPGSASRSGAASASPSSTTSSSSSAARSRCSSRGGTGPISRSWLRRRCSTDARAASFVAARVSGRASFRARASCARMPRGGAI